MDATNPKRRILVMDDEKHVREMFQHALIKSGYEVCLTGHGCEAIEFYQSAKKSGRPFHALIIDLRIKNGMGGMEAIGRLMNIDPDVKAIVCSGDTNHPAMRDYKHFGFIGALPKPFSFNELRAEVAKVMSEQKENCP